MALSGHPEMSAICPLSAVKRTWDAGLSRSSPPLLTQRTHMIVGLTRAASKARGGVADRVRVYKFSLRAQQLSADAVGSFLILFIQQVHHDVVPYAFEVLAHGKSSARYIAGLYSGVNC